MLVKKSLGRLIDETLRARNVSFNLVTATDGRLLYRIYSELLTPGEVADRFGIVWPRYES
jgi:hypothetical protein